MRFEYLGKSTDSFGVIVGSIDHSSTLSSGLEREIIKGETTDYRLVPNHFTTRYTSVIEFRRTLVKINGSTFTPLEREEIVTWLTSPKTPRRMTTYNYGCSTQGDKIVEYNGLFTNIEYETDANGIFGITFTFTNDSPFVYDRLERQYTINGNTELTLDCRSHNEEDYSYPVIDIIYGKDTNTTTNSGTKTATDSDTASEITIKNITDAGNEMKLKLLKKMPLTIDCRNLTVSDPAGGVGYDRLGWADMDDIYWLRLLSGENRLEVTANNFPINLNISCTLLKKAGEIFDYTHFGGYTDGTIVGDDTYRSIESVVLEILKKQLIPADAKEELDTLEEIAAWIQSHPDEADAMDKTLKSLQNLVGELPEDIEAEDLVSFVQSLTKALDNRVKAVESKMEWTKF